MTADLGWPRQVPSLAYACSMIGSGIGALYLGRLSDRVGMGPIALLGAVMISGGAVLTSFVTEPWQLYLIFGVMIGLLGNATIFAPLRSEEHTSELQSLMRISYAVFCLKKKKEQIYKK